MLEGKKTYLIGILIVISAIGYMMNIIEGEIFLKWLGILLGAGVVTTRIAISKIKRV